MWCWLCRFYMPTYTSTYRGTQDIGSRSQYETYTEKASISYTFFRSISEMSKRFLDSSKWYSDFPSEFQTFSNEIQKFTCEFQIYPNEIKIVLIMNRAPQRGHQCWVGIKRGNGMAEWRKRNGGIGDKTRNGSNGGIGGIKRGMTPMAE